MDNDTYLFFEGCKEIKNNTVVSFFSEQLTLSSGSNTEVKCYKPNCILVAITSPLSPDSYFIDINLNKETIFKQKVNFNKYSFLHMKLPFINYSPDISIHSKKERVINLIWAQLSHKFAEKLKDRPIVSINKDDDNKSILFSNNFKEDSYYI